MNKIPEDAHKKPLSKFDDKLVVTHLIMQFNMSLQSELNRSW